MSYLSRDEFLKPSTRRFRDVELGDGRKVRIQSLTEREKSAYEAGTLDQKGGLNRNRLESARRRLIVHCMVDEQGNRVLSDSDLGTLEKLDGAITSAIYNACREHCGFEDGDIEGLVKNSETITGNGSADG